MPKAVAPTEQIIVVITYVIAVSGLVSWIKRNSNASADKVDSPPQKPHVRASLMLGGRFNFVSKIEKQNPIMIHAIMFTEKVAIGI